MTASRRPNVLLVFADQMRAGATGAEGNREVVTPTLDRLAAEGVRVARCTANAPVCGPSRAMMLTGTWPATNGVVSNDLAVRTDLPTLATVARDAGYRCGYVGKWHLDGVGRNKFTPPGPRRLGFDDFWAAYNCRHRYADARYYRDAPEVIVDPRYEPEVQTDLALEFLSAADDRPWLLAVSWGPPHDPYAEVPEAYRRMYDPARLTLPPNVVAPLPDNPLARGLEVRRTLADYYAAVTALDAQLARLLDVLDGRDDETIVCFTSDHGDQLWSHGWMKKQAPYAESVGVPVFLRGPGLPRGTVSDVHVGLIDLTPTLLGLAGLPMPACDGRDFADALRGRAGDGGGDAQLIMNTHACDEAAMQGMPEWRGVRTRMHTYAERVPGVPWLLFDDAADPHQMNNLVDDPPEAGVRERLAARLRELLRDARDPFVSGDEWMARLGLSEAWAHREAHVND